MTRLFFSLLIVCAVLQFAACSGRYRLAREDLATGSAWPFVRGNADGKGAIQLGKFSGKFDLIWEQKVADKPAGPLTVYYGALVYPGTRKKARFFDIETGRDLGTVKVKGVPRTGVVMLDSVAYVGSAPKTNRWYGIDLVNKKTIVRNPVKDPAPGTIIVSNRLLVSSGAGQLVAYDLVNHMPVWNFGADGKFLAPATCGHGMVFQPNDRGVLYALSLDDGHQVFAVETDGPLVSCVAVAERVYAADMTGHVYAISPEKGEIVWQVDIGEPVWTSPAVTGDRVFVGHSGGGVVALEASSGRVLWNFDAAEVVRASPLVIDDWVVVGTMGGNVFLLDSASGRVVATARLKGAVFFPPVSDGRHVFVATQSGRIACFGERVIKHDENDH